MNILSFNDYKHVNESVRSELFKNGMCVMYSADGEQKHYYHYICLTEKDDIDTALEDLKKTKLFSETDEVEMHEDKYGVLVTTREEGMLYVCISDVIVNNILYIWDAKLNLKDCIKDEYIIDLSDKCTAENLIYEKDIDYSKIVTLLPDEPYFNYGFQPTDWSSLSRGYDAWALDHSINDPGSLKQPNPLYI